MAFIFGTPFNNLLFDQNSADVILAGAGNDTIYLINDGLTDSALGQQGNDYFYVLDRTGSNLVDGGTEFDTVNYSFLNESITLKAQGILQKASGGSDLLVSIESIVGDVGVGIVNTIDGSGSGTASLDVNLSGNSLIVNGTGAPSPLNFQVFNFNNVRGTDNNDKIVGNQNNNVFFGSRGHDIYDGGAAGFDTVDYSQLGQSITLKAQGIVDKGSAGVDQLLGNPTIFTPSIDRIVGATGFSNLIDGRVSGTTTTSFNVDLAQETLTVSGIGTIKVANFVNVIGTANSDAIEGNAGNNILLGQQGNDIIRGVNETSLKPGQNELDILVGGSGSDSFIVGDFFSKDYYLSQSTILDSFGDNDYALIVDFTIGADQLALSFTNQYLFNSFGFGVDIYANIGRFQGLDSRDDLLARVLFNSPVNLPVPTALSSLKSSQGILAPETAIQPALVTDKLTGATTGQLTGATVVNATSDATNVVSESQLQFQTIDEVFNFALKNQVKLPELKENESLGSVFTVETLPKEIASIFAQPNLEDVSLLQTANNLVIA
jgi:Ca2+-binding RTX toxin-like protein